MTDVSRETERTGEMGLSLDIVGSVAQSLGRIAVERENVTEEQVRAYMASNQYDEDELWTTLGPLIDQIEDMAATFGEPD